MCISCRIARRTRRCVARRCVPANYMAGGPTNDKMRAVLIDWMVEGQIQFKLLQETLFQTVDTIDRYNR